MIEVQGITKSFEGLQVLKGVDLRVDAGEIVSIVGPSGAGKTTLLQIMGTLDRPDSGRVSFDGEDPLSMNASRLARFRNRNVGFVFQFHQLLPEFTLLENVAMPALIGGRKRSDAFAAARRLVSACRSAWIIVLRNCRGANASGRRWPALWSTIPWLCSPTSRRGVLTRATAPSFTGSSSICGATSGRRL